MSTRNPHHFLSYKSVNVSLPKKVCIWLVHIRLQSHAALQVRPLAAYFIMNHRIYQSPDVYTVLSNRLLTSLSALQSSLDILRKHRPDYTPRTGFVWPITDSSIEDPTKKRTAEGDFSLTENETTSEVPHDNRKDTPKKQQNNWLLMNAMRTTAVHSKMSFSSSSFVQSTDNLGADPSATTTMRSSPSPAPTSQEPLPKTASSNIFQEPNKGPIGGGKKKRKRTSLAPPATTST